MEDGIKKCGLSDVAQALESARDDLSEMCRYALDESQCRRVLLETVESRSACNRTCDNCSKVDEEETDITELATDVVELFHCMRDARRAKRVADQVQALTLKQAVLFLGGSRSQKVLSYPFYSNFFSRSF